MNAAQPTDTIRDAFEAMLWFLACLIGPLRPRKITPAEEIGALAACEVETDFEPDEPPAPLLALRDIIQRAAEEHAHPLRIVYAGADWTPERIREARERCERATPGPWTATALAHDERPDTNDVCDMVNGVYVVSRSDLALFEHDAAFIAHAREDLPAALAWGEQQTRIAAGNAALEASQRAEIERLAAELAARAPADASLEARLADPGRYNCAARSDIVALLATHERLGTGLSTVARICRTALWLLDARAVDASRPGLTEEQARIFAPIVAAQSTSWPIYSVLQKLADAADHLLRGHGCDRHGYEEVEGARTAAREILGATGIEPGRFTARFAVDDRCPPARASRGETGPAAEPFENIEQLPPTLGPGIGGAPIRVRPPAGRRASLEAALHDPETAEGAAAILADIPPDPRATLPPCPRCSGTDWTPIPDSLAMACKACGAVLVENTAGGWEPGASLQEWAADLAAVDRQRATLHAGDPAAVQYCACGAAVAPGEDHPTGPRHDVARRPQ